MYTIFCNKVFVRHFAIFRNILSFPHFLLFFFFFFRYAKHKLRPSDLLAHFDVQTQKRKKKKSLFSIEPYKMENHMQPINGLQWFQSQYMVYPTIVVFVSCNLFKSNFDILHWDPFFILLFPKSVIFIHDFVISTDSFSRIFLIFFLSLFHFVLSKNINKKTMKMKKNKNKRKWVSKHSANKQIVKYQNQWNFLWFCLWKIRSKGSRCIV